MANVIRHCFVIGPMRDMGRLNRLAFEVIQPLLEPYGYTVSTPDHSDIGLVMNQILLSLEQADLLVADLTGNNPNVLYELGIYHSFGKPYIALKEETGQAELDKTPFDVAAYRYLAIDIADTDATLAVLQDFLIRSQLITKLDLLDFYSNPVTDFYLSPVAEIPTAIGLAKNYTKNFLHPVLVHPGIFTISPGMSHYVAEVFVEDVSNGQPGRLPKPLRPLTTDERDQLQLEILVPDKLIWSEKQYLIDLQQLPERPFINAQIIADRPYNCFARIHKDGQITLIDVPTIISSLNESIDRRRRSIQNVTIKAQGWELLEAQEIERFEAKCLAFLQQKLSPISRKRVRLIRWNGN